MMTTTTTSAVLALLATFLAKGMLVQSFSTNKCSNKLLDSHHNNVKAFVGPYLASEGKVITFTSLRATEDTEEENTKPSEESNDGEDKASAASGLDILNSPAFLNRKMEVLKNDVAQADEQIEELNQKIEMGKAEWGSQLEALDNEYKTIQERMKTRSEQGDDMAIIQVVREMLTVLDNFDRAFGQVSAEADLDKEIEEKYRNGYEDIFKTFEKLGVTKVETVGTEFDYEYHQAVMQRPSDEYDEGIVSEELQKGFVLGETLIRAAMVSVAA